MVAPLETTKNIIGKSPISKFRNIAIVPQTQLTAFEFFEWLSKNFYKPSITRVIRNNGNFELELEVGEHG